MTEQTFNLKCEAEAYRCSYKQGCITKKEAKEGVKPYIELFNEKAKRIAQKCGIRPKFISADNYLRSSY